MDAVPWNACSQKENPRPCGTHHAEDPRGYLQGAGRRVPASMTKRCPVSHGIFRKTNIPEILLKKLLG